MSRLNKIIVTVLCGLLLSSFSIQIDRELNSTALREDVCALRKALEKYHPGLYWYTSKQQFDLAWDSLGAKLDRPITEAQFFKLLLPVVAKVKCAHTLFYPSAKIISNGYRFPLDIKFIDKKAYIVSDISNQPAIPKGSELLSINGRPMNEILNLLLPNLEAQGGNIGWKYVILENDFQNYYYYLVEQIESFQIEYVDHTNGQKVHTKVNGSSEEKLRKHWKNWYPETDGPPLKIKYQDDKSLAVITVKSFTKGRYKLYNQDFDELIDQYFKEIREKGIQNLILDIRGNEGGNQPEKLYSYLMKAEGIGTNGQDHKIKPAKINFAGNVIVLANEKSISAQEIFVSIFKYYNRGLTIGRPTAGCSKYLCGGNKHKLVLPHSKFEINIPLHSYTLYNSSENHKKGEGYPPDFIVEESISDLLEGKDSAMELAFDKIR
jgi:hypothetical protein